MKIIFLDIDGVLNVIPQRFDKYGGEFHNHLVDNLRTIINQTGAYIVISSTWRMASLQTLRDMWKIRKLPGTIIDITPSSYFIEDLIGKENREIIRGDEIKFWLKSHPEISNYVIIDDDTDFLPEQMDNFVQTSENPDHPDAIDIGYGLTKICAQQAIKILNQDEKS